MANTYPQDERGWLRSVKADAPAETCKQIRKGRAEHHPRIGWTVQWDTRLETRFASAMPNEETARACANAGELLAAGNDLAIWLTGESHPEFQALAESEYDNAINQEQNPDSNHIKARMVARLLAAIAKATNTES